MDRNWKRGSLHCHTLWSDGCSLPEMAIRKYRELGYDFVCLSDHNLFQDRDDIWLPLHAPNEEWPPDLSYEEFNRTQELLPGVMEIKRIGFRTFVHLKSFDRLKAEYHKPGEFLLFPGEEITVIAAGFGEKDRKYDMHVNVFNVAKNFPCPREGTDREILHTIMENYNAAANGDSFLMMNHPYSRVWDIDPRLLMDTPEIRHFEICNNGSLDMPEGWIYDREQYWDFVLAHRLVKGNGILYGTASDDAHYYDERHLNKNCYCGSGWVMVDCQGELTERNIATSLKAGNFYSSSGVFLNDVVFDSATGTLEVDVKAEPGVNYRIDFITTKRDFDRSMVLKDFPMEKTFRSRTRPVIPDGIGKTVSSVNGTHGSYTMAPDDLYVRALITSDRPGMFQTPHYPRFETAWTQPHPNVRS